MAIQNRRQFCLTTLIDLGILAELPVRQIWAAIEREIMPKKAQPLGPDFREKIRVQMARLRMNQSALAEKSGLDKNTVWRLLSEESPATDAKLSTLLTVAKALKMDLEIDVYDSRAKRKT